MGNPPTYSSLELENSAPKEVTSGNVDGVAPTLHSVRTAAVMEPPGIDQESVVEPLLIRIPPTHPSEPGRVLRCQSVPASIGNSSLTAVQIGNHET